MCVDEMYINTGLVMLRSIILVFCNIRLQNSFVEINLHDIVDLMEEIIYMKSKSNVKWK